MSEIYQIIRVGKERPTRDGQSKFIGLVLKPIQYKGTVMIANVRLDLRNAKWWVPIIEEAIRKLRRNSMIFIRAEAMNSKYINTDIIPMIVDYSRVKRENSSSD